MSGRAPDPGSMVICACISYIVTVMLALGEAMGSRVRWMYRARELHRIVREESCWVVIAHCRTSSQNIAGSTATHMGILFTRLLLVAVQLHACSNIEAFNGSIRESIYGKHVFYNAADVNYTPPAFIRDSSISFDADGVMPIMLSVHPWSSIPWSVLKKLVSCKPSGKLQHGVVFASLGTHTPTGDHLGVLLRPASLSHRHSDTHRIKPVTAKDPLSPIKIKESPFR